MHPAISLKRQQHIRRRIEETQSTLVALTKLADEVKMLGTGVGLEEPVADMFRSAATILSSTDPLTPQGNRAWREVAQELLLAGRYLAGFRAEGGTDEGARRMGVQNDDTPVRAEILHEGTGRDR